MNTIKRIGPVVVTLLMMTQPSFASAQEAQQPKYSADVPEFLLTPDKVETEFLGDLEFFDEMPSESTVQKTKEANKRRLVTSFAT